MADVTHLGTRERLLAAAVEHIANAPGEDISMREVCTAVGVKMPTLYHFFGNKQGLLNEVANYGFDLYLGQKSAQELSGDPIQDIRSGWDAHVAFGIANPGLYSLMYGTTSPKRSPHGRERPAELLRALTTDAAKQGRLTVEPEQAAAQILATNIGVTLHQIALGAEDRSLSSSVREGVIAAITGTAGGDTEQRHSRAEFHRVLEFAAEHPEILGSAETQLLASWLNTLAAQRTDDSV